jgi:hypothetical protein
MGQILPFVRAVRFSVSSNLGDFAKNCSALQWIQGCARRAKEIYSAHVLRASVKELVPASQQHCSKSFFPSSQGLAKRSP